MATCAAQDQSVLRLALAPVHASLIKTRPAIPRQAAQLVFDRALLDVERFRIAVRGQQASDTTREDLEVVPVTQHGTGRAPV
jgi:hypothetical protein